MLKDFSHLPYYSPRVLKPGGSLLAHSSIVDGSVGGGSSRSLSDIVAGVSYFSCREKGCSG